MNCFLSFLLFAVTFCSMGADFDMTLSPARVAAGQTCQLAIRTTRNVRVDLGRPVIKNGTLLPGRSSSSSIINGRGTYSVVYFVRANEPGKLEIPPFDLTVDGKKVLSPALTAEVVPASAQEVAQRTAGDGRARTVLLKDAVFGIGSFPGEKRESYYVNEEIPLDLALYIMPSMGLQVRSYPMLTISDAVFRDRSGSNPENSRFEPVPRTPEFQEVRSNRYQVIRFRTAFRMLKPGEIKPAASIEVLIPESRSDDDDFFDSFFTRMNPRMVQHKVTFSFDSLPEVKALPTPPTHLNDLKLVGDWSLTGRIDSTALRAAEPFTFELTAAGSGSGDSIDAPELDIPGARVYPPEVIRGPQNAVKRVITLRYVIVPLRPGTLELKLPFCTFDSTRGRYRTYDFTRRLEVKPAERTEKAVTVHASADAPDTPRAQAQETRRENILYCKSAAPAFEAVELTAHPLLWLWIVCLIGGPVFFIAMSGMNAARDKFASSESATRKLQALRRRSAMLKKLKNASSEQFDDALVHDVIPYCCDYFNLPYGLSAGELADRLAPRDGELATYLRRSAADRFMPGAEPLSAADRKNFYHILKHLLVLLVLTAGFGVCADDRSQVRDLYDAGKFNEAIAVGEKIDADDVRGQKHADAHLRYNLGCAHVQKGDLPKALVRFEQAHKLLPRDSNTLENLNFVRRKLQLPEVGRVDSPGTLLILVRDSFTQSEYITAAALLYLLIFILLGFKRYMNPSAFGWTFYPVLLLLLLLGALFIARPPGNIAVVTGNSAVMRSLPSATNGSSNGKLSPGSLVELREKRHDFVLVSAPNASGWVKASEIMPIEQ